MTPTPPQNERPVTYVRCKICHERGKEFKLVFDQMGADGMRMHMWNEHGRPCNAITPEPEE
jgi:hypothetical protein